ncbi:cadherin-like beta sandwich domain-containing protein [Cohnella cellulosilytica]|uniref:Cadherin-like beta sandwich domain-containing protein n=1 Tax=Cohnella cellulosilytica TaxID=986710 RepID=A0ABW2F4K1_9BACL
MLRKSWNTGLAKLLVVALLLQCFPLIQAGGIASVYAEDLDGDQGNYESTSVTQSTYGPDEPYEPEEPSVTTVTYGNDHLIDYTWERMTGGTFKPNARDAAAMAYDEKYNNVVMFGGEGNSSLLDDTWIWTGGAINSWAEVLPTTKPAKRKHAAMAFDPVSQSVILFGGEGQSGTLLGDTWKWDGSFWTQMTGLTPSPSARSGAQMASDGQNLILFGGYTLSGSTKVPNRETWLWDGTSWSNATPADPGDSPPGAYNGQMSFNGQTAVMYGGITGTVTVSGHTIKDSSPFLWIWNADTKTWSSTPGPLDFGRWDHAMAYDGKRTVIFSGARDYIHSNNVLVPELKLPSSMYPYPRTGMAYGWHNGKWEESPQFGSSEGAFLDDVGYPGQLQLWPNITPFPITGASMAFDGSKFIVFGGHRDTVSVYTMHQTQTPDKQPHLDHTEPASRMNETWAFGYTPPSAPVIELVDGPLFYFDPGHIDDTVSFITEIQSTGGRTVSSRGMEYRPYTEEGSEEWISVPYTGTNPQGVGSFTVTLTGLDWHLKYEARGFAVNEIGKSYTEIKPFELEDDTDILPPEVRFDRVGATYVHVKDRKRIVAIGEGITNLLRKPLDQIHFHLKNGAAEHTLKYNILNGRQLELTWEEDLLPGKYDVVLEHDFYNKEADKDTSEKYTFPEGLQLIALDFYKPRDFAWVDVPSTSSANELSVLRLQGPFTETPEAPNVYELNDVSEVVAINNTVMFKGSSLVVDKSNSAQSVITGEGRLYVNTGGQGANASYTLYDGSFELTSNDFSIVLSDGKAADYLGIDMPLKPTKITFTKDGVNLAGSLELGFMVGSQKVSKAIAVDDLQYRYGRFELVGDYPLDKSFKVGPIDVSDTSFVIDSRYPMVNVKGKGKLPGTDIGFDLRMKLNQGRLDEIGFSMFNKSNLGSTGLQVDYLYGNVDKLAGKTQIPQRLPVSGSVTDVLVPQQKHPAVSSKFNLLGTDEIAVNLTPYGFDATGIEYYYWLPIKNMTLQAVVSPSIAGINGFSKPGFLASGDINAFDTIKGKIAAYSFNKKGYDGILKATVYVPKGIPRIGGATIRDVVLSVNDKQMIGMMKHNGINARVSYTFSNNTILFEVEAEPPKKSWWEKGLDFVGNLYNKIDDFFEKTAPLGDILEELIGAEPSGLSDFRLAAGDDWAKSFDFARFNTVAALPTASGEMQKVYEMTPVNGIVQPQDAAERNAKARFADGQLTSVEQGLPMTVQNAAAGQTSSAFRSDRAYEALIVMTGDQRTASLKVAAVDNPKAESAVRPETVYDAGSDLTFMRVSLRKGIWKLTVGDDSQIRVNELLFANRSLTLEQLAQVWMQTGERLVTSLLVTERGLHELIVDEPPAEMILYKPDGRPYHLETSPSQPGRNAFTDADGRQRILLDAAETGTWLIVAHTSPQAHLSRVPADTTVDQLRQWVQDAAYPTVFELDKWTSGQAIVEIYGADEHTKLYTPSGDEYAIQPDSNASGMNMIYDEAQRKMTVWIDGGELKGQWKAVGSSFASILAYKLNRKFKSIKPLINEGRYSKYFNVVEKGDYMLTVSGGNADTVILKPDGSRYTLDFTAPGGNAYVQPAADRVPGGSSGGDPTEQSQVATPYPAEDGRDMLYISLLDAPAGRWLVQNGTRTELEIQKLISLPEVKASVAKVADNRIRVTWSTANAAPGTEVALMLTGGKEDYIGDALAEALPASGMLLIDIPDSVLPGTYYLSAAATSEGEAPAYGVAEETVEVKASYALAAPTQLELLSTGNGEISLGFKSVSGQVEKYRVWIGEGAGSQPVNPAMDIEPQADATQQVVISGLPTNADYTVAVSAIGQSDGRVALSPLSASVAVTLPNPQPAALAVSLDAGGSPAAVKTKTVQAYDGSDRVIFFTAADHALLNIEADQTTAVTLTIDGQLLGSSAQIAAGGVHSFDLNVLLNVGALEEREYKLLVEAVNERGDRSFETRSLFVDRTGPLLIVSGKDDAGTPIPLNGSVDSTGKLLLVGQTDIGAKLVIGGTTVPLDDEGRFVYYAPLDWSVNADRIPMEIVASDAAGNTTEYGFEVLKDSDGTWEDFPGDLAALTVGGATLDAAYQFGKLAYEAKADSNRVRVFAVPMVGTSTVTIDGQPLSADGYVEVDVPDAGKTVQIRVQPAGSEPEKLYALQISGGSSISLLGDLTIKSQTDETIAAAPFAGTEETYEVYVDHTVEGVTLTPSALKAGSTVKVDGTAVPSGQASPLIALQAGENIIPVTVVSPDGAQSRVYQISVWRENSGDSELRQLGTQTSGAVLTPGFAPEIADYQVYVPEATTVFTLLPVAHPDAAVRVNGQLLTGSAATLPYDGDSLTVRIEVSAQDGSIRDYTLHVVRQKGSPEAPPLLSALEASARIDDIFTPYKLSYGTKQKVSQSSVSITATANDPLATVTVMGKTLQGGGSFSASLATGQNTINIRVESPDQKVSQTYSIGVTRVSSGSSTTEVVRQTKVTGGAGDWVVQIPIVRTVGPDGSVTDTVKLDADKAKDIVDKAKQGKTNVARIQVDDLPDDPAAERFVSLSAQALTFLSDNALSLQIELPEGVIELRSDSLKQLGLKGTDAYFRVVPIVAAGERKAVDTRVLNAELITEAAGSLPVSVIGHPIQIETNYTGFKTELLFRLDGLKLPADKAAAQRLLSGLNVYIEHSDGEKKLAHGEIRYNTDGSVAGIAVEVDKFSTFTIVRIGADEDGAADGTLEPYLSGYPDGTFRPSQSIKRAEFATILHRLGLEGADASAAGQAGGYQDVAAKHWAAEAIADMQRSGLMRGDNQGRFRPEAAVTRAEMASIVARLLPAGAADRTSVALPSDVQGHWASPAIGQALQAGILQGYPDGTFRPDRTLTRAEAVRVLNQLLERPTTAVSTSSWPDVPSSHWAIRDIESASGTVTVSSDGSIRIVK